MIKLFEQDVLVLDAQTESPEKFSMLEKAKDLANAINLTMVKAKLMDEEEGEGWSQEYTDHVERLYRRYLCMTFLNPKRSYVPTRDLDLFWHQHILDTRAYAEDCQNIFGYFLHHFPYFGMRGEEDAKDLLNSFEMTKKTYAHLFGEDYCSVFKTENATTCHRCSNQCKKCSSGCGGVSCTTCKNK